MASSLIASVYRKATSAAKTAALVKVARRSDLRLRVALGSSLRDLRRGVPFASRLGDLRLGLSLGSGLRDLRLALSFRSGLRDLRLGVAFRSFGESRGADENGGAQQSDAKNMPGRLL